MNTCTFPDCEAPTAKPGDRRYRYCKQHQGRRHGQQQLPQQCEYSGCGKMFIPVGPGRFRYCPDHRGLAVDSYRQLPVWRRRIPAGRVGTIHVHQVCIDLIVKGSHVWQAVDVHCPCDLIATQGNGIFRIEVTTGRWTTGTPPQLYHPFKGRVPGRWDVLAIVTDTGIEYQPELPEGPVTDKEGGLMLTLQGRINEFAAQCYLESSTDRDWWKWLEKAYPEIDLQAKLEKWVVWCLSNPQKAPRTNLKAGFRNWVSIQATGLPEGPANSSAESVGVDKNPVSNYSENHEDEGDPGSLIANEFPRKLESKKP